MEILKKNQKEMLKVRIIITEMKKALFGATLTTMALLYGMLTAIVIFVFLLIGVDVIYAIILGEECGWINSLNWAINYLF